METKDYIAIGGFVFTVLAFYISYNGFKLNARNGQITIFSKITDLNKLFDEHYDKYTLKNKELVAINKKLNAKKKEIDKIDKDLHDSCEKLEKLNEEQEDIQENLDQCLGERLAEVEKCLNTIDIISIMVLKQNVLSHEIRENFHRLIASTISEFKDDESIEATLLRYDNIPKLLNKWEVDKQKDEIIKNASIPENFKMIEENLIEIFNKNSLFRSGYLQIFLLIITISSIIGISKLLTVIINFFLFYFYPETV